MSISHVGASHKVGEPKKPMEMDTLVMGRWN